MNIFVLHSSPTIAARWHVDKHVVKMVLETTQLLTNCYYKSMQLVAEGTLDSTDYDALIPGVFEGFPRERPYKPTHMDHPCTSWACTNKENWEWLLELGKELCREYTFRYDKQHACSPLLQWMTENHPVLPESSPGQTTPFPCVVPEKYQIWEDPIRNYRTLYTFGKVRLHNWTNRKEPFFIKTYKTLYTSVIQRN